MFGKSNHSKKIKELEEAVKKLKQELASQKTIFQRKLKEEKEYHESLEGTKYLDTACIEQLITHLKNKMTNSKSFYYFYTDFAYNLCYIDTYQKMILEKILRVENLIQPIPNK